MYNLTCGGGKGCRKVEVCPAVDWRMGASVKLSDS